MVVELLTVVRGVGVVKKKRKSAYLFNSADHTPATEHEAVPDHELSAERDHLVARGDPLLARLGFGQRIAVFILWFPSRGHWPRAGGKAVRVHKEVIECDHLQQLQYTIDLSLSRSLSLGPGLIERNW